LPGALIAAALACAPVPGLDLLKPETVRVLWFGEIHGTNEQPKMFGDIVCALSARRGPIVVVLERGASELPAWSRYMMSPGTRKDRLQLTAGGLWTDRLQDGRSSQAMLMLAERLRRLSQAGRIEAIRFSIDARPSHAPGPYEQSMGEAVERAATEHRGALVLALSGNGHARRTTNQIGETTYRLAANYVPGMVSIDIESGPGLAWNCQMPTCGPHSLGSMPLHPRGIAKAPPDSDFDLVASTGSRTTASRPARGAGKPVKLDLKS